ncbi:2-oxo acid dehydrogenase subunit E2 [Rhodoblastus sp.]|jgi:pyruvate dehydrogenase E2 component (dihydrolipoamide acetyltransferase)|uniref:2-oxo acid dehydrogenase subunit E2 n=1 Tax=Rhodoblastus sp. TaxID=1962975 RepID=UPI0025EFA5C0|nr:2-oxo acid dehydrogenase subunit E2 [Rhodoblastus sp.]
MAIAILMPSLGAAMRTAKLSRWLLREGDFVEAGEPVAEIATPHATMDVEAPRTGVLARIIFAAGEAEIAGGAEIGLIEPGPAPHLPSHSPPFGASEAVSEGCGARTASPRARRLAREAGFDLSGLLGSGPHGRIVEADVRAAIEAHGHDARLSGATPLLRTPDGRRAPLIDAAQWSPQVHLEADCRIDALEALRAQRNDATRATRATRKTRISLLDCVVKALALALDRTPRANVALTPKGYMSAHGAGVALGLVFDGDIVAPALPAAEAMSLDEIAAARAAFLAGRFSPNCFAGGVSLIVNLGSFGVKRVFPLVMAPWTSVLGLGASEKRVVVEDGAASIATVLSVTLAIDRRAMDETAAGALLAAFRGLIERPAGLLD